MTTSRASLKMDMTQGAWVTQLMKRPTLDFSSGHDLRVVRSSPASGSCWAWSLLKILSPLTLLSLSLSLKKQANKEVYACGRYYFS